MITVRCPVRISLIGGSSDLDSYITKHGRGSVISFTPQFYTYVSLYRDTLGRNVLDHKYIVNYSRREETEYPNEISNDLVREHFVDMGIDPCSVHMTSDVFSHGSGLAVSSSYACALVMATSLFQKEFLSDIECANRAHLLEKKINPLLGMQDVYGCCVGGFKKIVFERQKNPAYTFLPTGLFSEYDMYLRYTGHARSSTEQLKNVVVPDEDTFNPLVEEAEKSLLREDYGRFMELFAAGWKEKKKTSIGMLSNSSLLEMDEEILGEAGYVAHKLCGAGNGGFFLVVFRKNSAVSEKYTKVALSSTGVYKCL